MSEPWLDYQQEEESPPWADYAKRPPKESSYALYQKAVKGDKAALEAYNTRAQTYGQNTIEQDREQNSPVGGQNFAQNAWQAVGRYWPNLARNLDSPQEVDRARQLDAPLMGTGGGMAGTIGSNVAMLAAPQSKLTAGLSAAGKAAPFISGATVGAVAGATDPVGSGESRLGNTGRAAIWGAGGEVVGKGLSVTGKWLATKATPAQIEVYKQAQKMGIELTPAQLTDSRWIKTIASQSKYWPGSGFAKAQANQQGQFNRAASRTLGQNADVIDDPLIAQTKANQAALYDKAFDGVQVKMDQAALGQFQALKQTFPKRLKEGQQAQFNAIVDDFTQNLKGGKIEGKVYQEIRRDLKALEAENKDGLGRVIKDFRNIVEGAAERSVPKANQDALKAADRLTRNIKVVEQARKRVANANDNIAPTSLWQPANGKFGATPEMRALAKLGQQIKDPIADSGTAARLDTLGLYGLATALPKMGVNKAINSPLLSRALVQQPKAIEGTSKIVGGLLARSGVPAYMIAPKDKKKKK